MRWPWLPAQSVQGLALFQLRRQVPLLQRLLLHRVMRLARLQRAAPTLGRARIAQPFTGGCGGVEKSSRDQAPVSPGLLNC